MSDWVTHLFPLGSAASEPPTLEPSEELALLRTLAERSLSTWFPNEPEPRGVQLWVGTLPDDLPIDLPVPEGAHIIGSLRRERNHLEVTFDAPQPVEAVKEFYRRQLTAAGWYEQEPEYGMGGFVQMQGRVMFCQGRRGPGLSIMAHEAQSGVTPVRLMLYLDARHSPCRPHHNPAERQVLPRLTLPPGVRVSQRGLRSGGGGYGGGSAHTSTALEGDITLTELATHYGAQLEAAQWVPQASGDAGPVAWSRWSFEDEEGESWKGLFFALDMSEYYFVFIRADMEEDDDSASGPTVKPLS